MKGIGWLLFHIIYLVFDEIYKIVGILLSVFNTNSWYFDIIYLYTRIKYPEYLISTFGVNDHPTKVAINLKIWDNLKIKRMGIIQETLSGCLDCDLSHDYF